MQDAGVDLNKVAVRLNPSLDGMGGITLDAETVPTFDYIVKQLNEYPLAYLHLVEPITDISGNKFAVQQIAKHYRPLYKGTLIINRSFDKDKGNKVIADNEADLVAYGKPFIANPDLVERFAKDAPLAKPDKDTFYTPGSKGYTDYPTLQEIAS